MERQVGAPHGRCCIPTVSFRAKARIGSRAAGGRSSSRGSPRRTRCCPRRRRSSWRWGLMRPQLTARGSRSRRSAATAATWRPSCVWCTSRKTAAMSAPKHSPRGLQCLWRCGRRCRSRSTMPWRRGWRPPCSARAMRRSMRCQLRTISRTPPHPSRSTAAKRRRRAYASVSRHVCCWASAARWRRAQRTGEASRRSEAQVSAPHFSDDCCTETGTARRPKAFCAAARHAYAVARNAPSFVRYQRR
mmetsp:Transcript_67478/g.179459  ORF Transcript_67478/g.179459 Transcript_67478/m.179459 type:complete len:246 (+) Transcript_67478:93-830(+)